MSEIIQQISYENNGRFGSDYLSDQNDQWNSNLSKKRLTCVLIGSFSINDGCVIDKQYNSLSCLIISFGTATEVQLFIDVLEHKIYSLFLYLPAYSQNMVAYIVNIFII